MLRTNNKKVTAAVDAFVLNAVKEVQELEDVSLEEYLKNTLIRFYAHERKSISYNVVSYYDSLGEFLINIAGIGGYYYYDDMRNMLAEWLEETPEEANRYDNEKVSKTFCYLVERSFRKLLSEYGLDSFYSRSFMDALIEEYNNRK